MKKWYLSKTVWVNLLAAGAVVAQTNYGFVFGAEYQSLALVLVNLILRKVTKEEIVW